ncbi:MAG: carboxypeptidase-like regulatory domain-containing protein [Ferruginibacter sp.]|nr:carboxypeptidase-like regulatory domain-containing protein [Chitinophagaceae bacterium]
MRKALLLLLPVLLCSPFTVFSQLLKGRVLNESGGNASGVSVRFQNKSNGISTQTDGTFKIIATQLPDTLVFSAVGMESYKVVITEKNIKDPGFEVVLLNQRKAMDEVVVTALGASRRSKELSYSVITRTEPVSGKVPGIEAREDRYEKSSFKVRGTRTVTATSPSGKQGDKFFSRDTSGRSSVGTAKTRTVTAGEVNDFNKWKMWEDYTENEFKSLSGSWGMRSTGRYSIQVTDKKHNAVMNEAVYLISKASRDTVWRAFTDNTGKAELWAGFFKDSLPAGAGVRVTEDYFISDRYGNSVSKPTQFSNGVNVLVVDRTCQVSYDADIAFVVDATGSMGDEIEFLKLELEDVIRNTMEKHKSLTLRAASVFYRDKRDEYLTKNVGFNEDLLKTLNFIKLQNAGGGGDYPEAVDDALSTALDSLRWNTNTRTKLLFLILDAPPHQEARERIQQLTLKAAAMGIRIVPIACSGTDKSTEFMLRSMALATNGTYTFLTNHSGVGNSHIEPTTDKYEIELLNNLLQRIIGQFLYARECGPGDAAKIEQPELIQPGNILSVKIYPNPTHGRFVIESKKDLKEIFIADFAGKILMRLPVADKKGRWQIDIGHYPSGTYLVKYITADNKWGAEKIILMR